MKNSTIKKPKFSKGLKIYVSETKNFSLDGTVLYTVISCTHSTVTLSYKTGTIKTFKKIRVPINCIIIWEVHWDSKNFEQFYDKEA
ncbi:MAG: hypothetical protein ABIP51_04150 [Bacteroidia bacterium]